MCWLGDFKPAFGGACTCHPLLERVWSMPRLTIALLGPPHVERDGRPISMDTRKAVALLSYLAVTGERQPRDSLAALLYPDYDQSHARAALRRTLSALKSGIGDQWLEVDRESVALAGNPSLWCDVHQFHRELAACRNHSHQGLAGICPVCVENLERAVALYRGDFLAGFSLRDSLNFDDWQFFQAESLRHEVASALECLAGGLGGLGQFEPAIAHARHWLALDPLHEPAHRALMLLYAWAGQHAAALRQYRECIRVLEQELGVPPLAETTALYEAILHHQEPKPPARMPRERLGLPAAEAALSRLPVSQPPDRKPGPRHQLPLMGRNREWQALAQAHAAASPAGHILLLQGELGIGKTRLAEDFLHLATAQGAAILAARCYEGQAHLAYGPFLDALRTLLRQPELMSRLDSVPPHWLAEAARLLPELSELRRDLPPAPTWDSPGAPARFLEGIGRCITALLAGPVPGIVFLDDLQWIDEASLDLLAYLVRRLEDHPLFLLGTCHPQASPTTKRIQHLMAEAHRAGNGTTKALGRLTADQVAQLVALSALQPAAMPPDVSHRLYQLSEGLPLFLVEYLMALAADHPDHETWEIPGTVRDLLQARLARIGETSRQILAAGAVIGRSFDYDLLHAASGRSEEETMAALEELLGLDLVRDTAGAGNRQQPSYDFSHQQLRELIYEDTSQVRRRILHRRIAEALALRARSPQDRGTLAGLIAYHYAAAGCDHEAASAYRLAGNRARVLLAHAQALSHYRAALALGYPQPAELHEAIGDLETLTANYQAAVQSYETAAALAPPQALAALEHKLGRVKLRRGDWEAAEAHFQAALDMADRAGTPGLAAGIYTDWALTAHRSGQSELADSLAGQAVSHARASEDPLALAEAHNVMGILARHRHDLASAADHLRQSLALARQAGHTGAEAAALNNLALVHGQQQELEPAIRYVESALAIASAEGDRHREAALHNNLADLFQRGGRKEEAMQHLKQAVAIFAAIEEDGSAAVPSQPEIWKLVEW